MALSWTQAAARQFVTRFLKAFISVGSLTLLEEDGTVLTFEGSLKICPISATIRIHNPQFYYKVAMEADFGFANSYSDGDFSFIDKDHGLLNVIRIFIANKYQNYSISAVDNRGWWTSLFTFTTWIGKIKYMYSEFCRRNTLTQARRNISDHYDLSNEMFSLFIGETMAYSCAVFKTENEDLKVAQMRKISLLIEKARVKKEHEVLEFGCGWGSLGIEVARRTGCKYTGITLSKEQLNFAEEKAKKAGLQDRVKFLLCDYRQLKDVHKYDRIIACEMFECVGHEYMEEFFRRCDLLLATNGLLVTQISCVPDENYDEFRRSPGFIKEYIFPGGILPSISRVTSAMAAASRLCVEHLENIGDHYYQTLRCWREAFLENQSEIISLGFNGKFIRTMEFYFDYCAAGFKMRMLGNYQIVFSRQGNVATFSDPYASIPSAHCCP